MGVVEDAVAALQSGASIVLPTDTVYGLAASADDEAACRGLYELKREPVSSPVALLAAGLDALLDRLPELHPRDAAVARALLPGPFTLVLPNPGRRYGWLCGANPDAVGVRVPRLTDDVAAIVAASGAVAATSANFHGHGGPDPRRVGDVAEEIRRACGAVVDGGELPGTASTVLDFTGAEPVVLREGAAPSSEAVERALAARRSASLA